MDHRPILELGPSGMMDLIGFEEPSVADTAGSDAVHVLPDRHIGFPCRQCQRADYRGLRHSCFFCKDYHLCGNCFASNNRPESPHHKYYHIMQVFYTRTAYELFFGGEPYTGTGDWQSFQCALCLQLGFTIQTLYQHLLQSHRDHPDHRDYLLMTYSYYFVDRSSRNAAPTPPTAADQPPPGSVVFPDRDEDNVPIIELEIIRTAQVEPARSANREAAAASFRAAARSANTAAVRAAATAAARSAATAATTATVAGAGASNDEMEQVARALRDVRDRLRSLDPNSDSYEALCTGLLMRARCLHELYALSSNTVGIESDVDRVTRQIERDAFTRLYGSQSTFVLGEVPSPAASSGLVPLIRQQWPATAPPVAGGRAAATRRPSPEFVHPSLNFPRHQSGNQFVPISFRGSQASAAARYEALNHYAILRGTHQAERGPHGVQAGVPIRIPTSTQTAVAAPPPPPPNTGTAITELPVDVAEPDPPENPIDKLDLNDGRFLSSRLKERFEKMPENTEEEGKVAKARLVDAVFCSMLSEKDLTSVPVDLLLMQEMGSTATTTVAANEPKPLEEPLTVACGAEEGLNQVPRLMQLAQNAIRAPESAVDPMIKYFNGLVDYNNWLGRFTISVKAEKGATEIEAKEESKEPEAQPTSSNRYLENILQISSSGNNGQDGDDDPNDQNPIAFIDRNDGDDEDDDSNDDDSNDSKMGNYFANDDDDNGNMADNDTNDDASNTYPYEINIFVDPEGHNQQPVDNLPAAPDIIEGELSGSEVSYDEDEDLYNEVYDYDYHIWED